MLRVGGMIRCIINDRQDHISLYYNPMISYNVHEA